MKILSPVCTWIFESKGWISPNESNERVDIRVNLGDIWQRYHDSRELERVIKKTTKKTLTRTSMVAPVSETERTLESICRSLLNQENICVETDFFLTGMTSLILVHCNAVPSRRRGA